MAGDGLEHGVAGLLRRLLAFANGAAAPWLMIIER
jgi:hypothetical protein